MNQWAANGEVNANLTIYSNLMCEALVPLAHVFRSGQGFRVKATPSPRISSHLVQELLVPLHASQHDQGLGEY